MRGMRRSAVTAGLLVAAGILASSCSGDDQTAPVNAATVEPCLRSAEIGQVSATKFAEFEGQTRVRIVVLMGNTRLDLGVYRTSIDIGPMSSVFPSETRQIGPRGYAILSWAKPPTEEQANAVDDCVPEWRRKY
jgi:hypothetical protein